jgi:uncharacterized protein (DUF302 family)
MLRTATSPHSVPATADRIASALERRGVQLFARIDHAAGARAAGLELADEQLLIFGDPRVGTLLMQEDPAVGYELPLRLLVWDSGGETLVGYRSPTELSGQFYGLRKTEVLERMEQLLDQLVAEAASP